MKDLGPPEYLLPAFLIVIVLLALTIVFLGPQHRRARRSLALLLLPIAVLAAMIKFLPQPMPSLMSLAFFLGIFVVFRWLGQFDSPE